MVLGATALAHKRVRHLQAVVAAKDSAVRARVKKAVDGVGTLACAAPMSSVEQRALAINKHAQHAYMESKSLYWFADARCWAACSTGYKKKRTRIG